MSGWIEYHLDLWDHWKIHRLKDQLRCSYNEALGAISCLWLWAARNAQNGSLKRFTDEEIKLAARWLGDTKPFSDALTKSGLLTPQKRIHDWHKYGMKLLLSTRARSLKYRDKKRDASRDGNVRERKNHGIPNLTQPNLTIHNQTEKENIKEKDSGELQNHFQPPSPPEVEAYAKSIGFDLDGEKFCAHYQASGWIRGKNKITDWRACVVTWKKNEKERINGAKHPGNEASHKPGKYSHLGSASESDPGTTS